MCKILCGFCTFELNRLSIRGYYRPVSAGRFFMNGKKVISPMKLVFVILLIFTVNFRTWSFEISLSTPTPVPGDTLAIDVKEVKPGMKYSCWFNASKYPVYPTERDSFRTLIGITYDFVPGKYAILILEKEKGKKAKKKYRLISIGRKEFALSYVTFSSEERKLIGSPLNERERDLISIALKAESENQNWKGKFVLPVEAKIVGEYGVRRMAGGEFLWNHRGVDLKVPEGTAVRAPNDGEVILAEEKFYLHGKTIIIDHGQGVITIYLHLRSINVRKGDKVTKGQIIGRVGETGLATAPHLHWGVYVHGVPVNPVPWVEREY